MKAEPDWHSGLSLAGKQLPKKLKKPPYPPWVVSVCWALGQGGAEEPGPELLAGKSGGPWWSPGFNSQARRGAGE